jgi:hypothetical protein
VSIPILIGPPGTVVSGAAVVPGPAVVSGAASVVSGEATVVPAPPSPSQAETTSAITMARGSNTDLHRRLISLLHVSIG